MSSFLSSWLRPRLNRIRFRSFLTLVKKEEGGPARVCRTPFGGSLDLFFLRPAQLSGSSPLGAVRGPTPSVADGSPGEEGSTVLGAHVHLL